jgi:hypothetical protein
MEGHAADPSKRRAAKAISTITAICHPRVLCFAAEARTKRPPGGPADFYAPAEPFRGRSSVRHHPGSARRDCPL